MKKFEKYLNELDKVNEQDKVSFDINEFMKSGVKVAEKELSKVVSKLIGMNITLKIEVQKIRGKDYLRCKSTQMIKESPKIFEKLWVETFNSNISDTEPLWWQTIDYKWDHIDGGSNGAQICSVWVTQDGKIKRLDSKF